MDLKRDIFFVMMMAVIAYGAAHYLGLARDPQPATPIRVDPDIAQSAAALDAQFRTQWQQSSLQPAGPADTLTVARRLALGLTGTVPSLQEIRSLESLPQELAIATFVDQLLRDRRSADYLAERFARVYVGVEGGPFIVYRRRRFVSWLSDQLYENVPYDQISRQLITAQGLWTDKPAVNFLTVTTGGDNGDRPDEKRLAARVARSMLAVRLDCVQCHDDNLGGDWLQSDFHELAAFFSEASPTFAGLRDSPHEYRTRYLGATEDTQVVPAVPFADDLLTADGNRRSRLAEWVTDENNRPFARSIVNRIWALAFGRPLVEPVDSIPLEGPYPPGLEMLADGLTAHNYDLRWLWKVIAASEVFRMSSQAAFELTPEHEREWAVFPLTRLRPEQVAGAILQSARLNTLNADSHILLRFARQNESREFVQRYGDAGEDEFSQDGGTIPQRLLMLNGQLVHEKTKDDLVINACTRITALAGTADESLEAMYLVTLTRRPSATESVYFETLLSESYDDNRKLWGQHVVWSLINSSEFSWNH